MTWTERFRDAAFASNIPAGWGGGVAGYVNGGDPFHAWSSPDWHSWAGNRRLPIFVRSNPGSVTGATSDGFAALEDLWALRVPAGKYIALDLETAEDPAYVQQWTGILEHFGYLVIVYGSASSVFKNPAPRYWVAQYQGTGPYMYHEPGQHVIMTQYQNGQQYDSSTCAAWQYFDSHRWWT